jgi:spore germination cell wall hydrolase CwlJ-like protein
MARRRRRTRRDLDPAILAAVAFTIAIIVAWAAIRSCLTPKLARPKLTMEEARVYNAQIPFAITRRQAAAPFHFRGTPAAREQATHCLATAALYEAGSDEVDQRAVIQVVLNRVRLPQYPHTVCGVVYQGAALTTGCQFSFTCDNSLTRRPEHLGWGEARTAAKRALGGYVFRPVGRATHYHADWMVPYWIGSLDKIAQIRTHIFYRPKARGSNTTLSEEPGLPPFGDATVCRRGHDNVEGC